MTWRRLWRITALPTRSRRTYSACKPVARAQQISARVGLEGSRQQAEFHRQRGSLLELRVEERTAQLEATQLEMLELLASAAECRDAPSGLHATWVGEASAHLARQLGWAEAEAHNLGLAARLHDIGKLAVPDAVLLKEGPLSAAERTLMQTHTTLGAKLLRHSTSPLLHLAADVALSHHERWDGLGYPGVSGGAVRPRHSALGADRGRRGRLRRSAESAALQSGLVG